MTISQFPKIAAASACVQTAQMIERHHDASFLSRDAFSDCAPQPLQFLAHQEQFAAAFLELDDTARGVGAFRNDARPTREAVHAADYGKHAIGLEGCVGQLPTSCPEAALFRTIALGLMPSGP
jgi:hypothetical protein